MLFKTMPDKQVHTNVVLCERKKKSLEWEDQRFMKTQGKICQLHKSTFKALFH